jgi:hypothetical protein
MGELQDLMKIHLLNCLKSNSFKRYLIYTRWFLMIRQGRVLIILIQPDYIKCINKTASVQYRRVI